MSKQLRALKTEEEIAAVPLDQPVLVELPGSVSFDTGNDDADKGGNDKTGSDDDAGKRLSDELTQLKEQVQRDRERADQAERDRQEAVRVAAERDEENRRLRAARESDETILIKNGLSAAQSERDAAKAAFQQAFDAGDSKAMADAQERIGRAAAKIVSFEDGAAEAAERAEQRKNSPEIERRQATHDFATSVNANPNLLRSEKDWMIKNKASFDDPDFNKRLDFAYQSAMRKDGLVRGSDAYFDFIEKATGLKQTDPKDDNQDQGSSFVSAPVSRNERGSDGRVTNGRIILSPEQREIAKSLGVSDIEYARQVQALDQARRDDPEKYR